MYRGRRYLFRGIVLLFLTSLSGGRMLFAHPQTDSIPTSDHQKVIALLKQALQSDKPEERLSFSEKALEIARSLADPLGEVKSLLTLGNICQDSGQLERAQKYYQQALSQSRHIQDRRDEAGALLHLGNICRSTDQPGQALEFYQEAHALFQALQDRRGEANTLNNQGVVYRGIGQSERAQDLFQQALKLYQALQDRLDEAHLRLNLGNVYQDTKQWDHAQECYRQALPLFQSLGDKASEGKALTNLGNVLRVIGQLQDAQAILQKALTLYQTLQNVRGEAIALTNMGLVDLDSGRHEEAIVHCKQALPLFQAVEDRSDEIYTLTQIAFIYRLQGRLADSERVLRLSLALLEDIRQSLQTHPEDRMAFLRSHLESYHIYLDLLLQQHRLPEAFDLVQKTKARALLDLMQDAHVVITRTETLDEQRQEQALSHQAAQLSLQLGVEASNPRTDSARLKTLHQQMQRADTELVAFTNTLYVRHPALARQRAANTLTLNDLARFLPEDTALLEYVALPSMTDRPELEKEEGKLLLMCATRQGAHMVLHSYTLSNSLRETAQKVAAFHDMCAQQWLDFRPSARALYRLALAPALPQLVGKKRLIFCPDGPLWGLPLQALLMPTDKRGKERFVFEQFEVSYAYSATALQAALLARQQTDHAPASKTLLVMAAPAFGGGERFGELGSVHGTTSSAASARSGGLSPLPGTIREAHALKTAFPEAVLALGSQAQESRFKREGGEYRYLHLATHAFFNDTAPQLSGLVLAEPPKGSVEDGILTARDIFSMRLSAEMVVLSACDTGRGEVQGGEGLVGLLWSLFVAGSPSAVVSEWCVSDASTGSLMGEFYRRLKRGETKSGALRAAMLSVLEDGHHAHPYYWAPFVLVGNWK